MDFIRTTLQTDLRNRINKVRWKTKAQPHHRQEAVIRVQKYSKVLDSFARGE